MDYSAYEESAPVDFGGLTSAKLLACITMRLEDDASARAAMQELSRRHRSWLKEAVLRTRLLHVLGEGVADDIVQETFVRVWERAKTFRAPVECEKDVDRYVVRAWLGRIANRVAASMLRSHDALAVAAPLPEEEVIHESIPVIEEETLDLRVAREELEGLPAREKDVVLEWLMHYKAGEPHQRLPNAVSRDMAARWSTTTDNIRQVRARTLRQLKETIERRTGRKP